MFPCDIMGQWQCCTKTTTKASGSGRDKEYFFHDPIRSEGQVICGGRPSVCSDSAVDSGNSSGDDDEGNPCDATAVSGRNSSVTAASAVNNNDHEGPGRHSHSSDSSGKFSLRDSISSSGDFDRYSSFHPGRIDECTIDMPVFAEEESEELSETLSPLHSPVALTTSEALQECHYYSHRSRKISRGSRGSTSSERGSFSSVSSVTAVLKARLGRSSSLVSQYDHPEAETHSTCSVSVAGDPKRPQRTVSLRLSKSHHRSHDSDTNLPTIYVDDSPKQSSATRSTRKSSLRRALSLLSMNSLMKNEAAASTTAAAAAAAAAAATDKSQKPVQKILRQPRRRHNTVRGLSGLAIDGANQSARNPCLYRSHTVYYPTATSLRYATTNTRRTHSVNS